MIRRIAPTGTWGVILVDFFDVASAFEILHDGLGLDAGAFYDGLSAHLSGHGFGRRQTYRTLRAEALDQKKSAASLRKSSAAL
jgi:hypothetical protein